MEDFDEKYKKLTYTHCHICNQLWEPYYGMLDIKDDVVPGIIIYTCMNCLSKKKEHKIMKQIILCPIVIVTVDNEDKIFVDINFSSSISEAMDDDGNFRDVTDEERTFIDEKVLPFITKSIDL